MNCLLEAAFNTFCTLKKKTERVAKPAFMKEQFSLLIGRYLLLLLEKITFFCPFPPSSQL